MEIRVPDIIIAIDGHSSCGKSTLAKALAKKLDFTYIDTGAMYRAVTLYILDHQIDINDHEIIRNILPTLEIRFKKIHLQRHLYLNQKDVESEIRSMRISNQVSEVSAIPVVREHVVDLQREMGAGKRIVMEGRDIGTVVFPEAGLKLFLTARLDVRVDRRHKELLSKGIDIDRQKVLENLQKRDRIDSTRAHSPLRQAKDAIVIDNSDMTIEDQVDYIMKVIGNKYQEGLTM